MKLPKTSFSLLKPLMTNLEALSKNSLKSLVC